MNATIKIAALAALIASATAFAEEPYKPAPATEPQTAADPQTATDTQMGTENQWPDFATLDANADGAISKDEAQAQGLVASRFGELDGDKNGKLSGDEYKKGLDKTKPANP